MSLRRTVGIAGVIAVVSLLLPGTGVVAASHCPAAALGYAVLPAEDMSLPPGAEVATRESTLSACLLSTDSGRYGFDLGMDYAYVRHEYDGVAGRDRDLHRLQLPLTLRRHGDGWRVDALFAPGVATSSNVFKDLGSRASDEDFLLTGRIELRLRRGPRSAWLLGAAHDRSLGVSRTLPVVGLEYRPSAALGLRLAWPDPSVQVAVSARQSVVLDVVPAGQRWHVVSDELGDTFDYRLEGWHIRATWSYRLKEGLTVDVGVARELGREHGFLDDTGRSIDAGVDAGYVFTLGIRLGGMPLPRGRGAALPRLASSTPAGGSGYSAAMSDQTRNALLIDLDGVIYEGERAVDGAQKPGIGGVLVRTGKYRGEESTEDVRPTAVLDSIADLPDWWRGR
ncbi:HAD hydrolase-like protein [Lentisalinibacter sediminis]|uniref:HAD hydrolase-like protein n=1 Tax=Lentisalinibacter sediminis TaxID=2992237 RepID=UPI003866DE78